MNDGTDQSLMAAILPHEPMLRAWLRSQFQRERDIDDIVQESFMRLMRAARKTPLRSPKAFLFTTARNLIIGNMRKAVRHGEVPLEDFNVGGILDDTEDVAQSVSDAEELKLLFEAIQSLPERCREVITLRQIHGLSQKEVARRLGISENPGGTPAPLGLRKAPGLLAAFDSRSQRP